jgi:DNA-binding transcriptional ArsR family regulator
MEALERLVCSGLCSAQDGSSYKTELLGLAANLNEREGRRRSEFFSALSDPTRVKILELLTIREMCGCEIIVALGLSQPTVSHHVSILVRAGLLTYQKKSRWVFYSISKPGAVEALMRFADEHLEGGRR